MRTTIALFLLACTTRVNGAYGAEADDLGVTIAPPAWLVDGGTGAGEDAATQPDVREPEPDAEMPEVEPDASLPLPPDAGAGAEPDASTCGGPPLERAACCPGRRCDPGYVCIWHADDDVGTCAGPSRCDGTTAACCAPDDPCGLARNGRCECAAQCWWEDVNLDGCPAEWYGVR